MIIAVDTGNTHLELALMHERRIVERAELRTADLRPGAAALNDFCSWVKRCKSANSSLRSAVLGSVVPAVTPLIGQVLSMELGLEVLTVSTDIKLNIKLGMDSKCTLGMDRMANAVAAAAAYQLPALVIDLGTASTFDYINAEACFEGGAIAPGMQMGLDALHAGTAKLPALRAEWPESVVGTDTRKAMLAGGVRGYLAMVDGMISAIEMEKGPLRSIICTGGLGSFIVEHSGRKLIYDADVTFTGLAVLAELNGLS